MTTQQPRGQAMMEFALVLCLLSMIAIGGFEYFASHLSPMLDAQQTRLTNTMLHAETE